MCWRWSVLPFYGLGRRACIPVVCLTLASKFSCGMQLKPKLSANSKQFLDISPALLLLLLGPPLRILRKGLRGHPAMGAALGREARLGLAVPSRPLAS